MTTLEELISKNKKIDRGGDQSTLTSQTDYRMVNERITENIVRGHFNQDPLVKTSKVLIEEQKSVIPRIEKLLKNASKKGSGAGKPEFIISFKEESNLVIVIECKSDITKHESKTRDHYSEYAVDGVLLYSSFLSKDFDVISIAVSGEIKKDLKVSHFLQIRGRHTAENFLTDELLTLGNYLDEYKKSDLKLHQDLTDLMAYSKKLNTELHKLKIKEARRSLLISGILLALRNEVFKISYEKHKKPEELSRRLIETISIELKAGNIQPDKIKGLEREYSFIPEEEAFSSDVSVLKNIIQDIDKNLNNFIKTNKYYDVLGQFYIEFLSYANSDKGLGIVLTPPHITELFSEIAKVNKDSIVFDNCCGTGGFLISAMKKMIEDAKGNSDKIKEIKSKQLVGIEYQMDIFALACSNMFIHGDGTSSIYQGDCFKNKEIIQEIKEKFKPNIGFLNPPYKTNTKADIEEFEYVLNNLEMLEPNGICVSIIPMSCVTATGGELLELKKKLMQKHTLEAVFSMPNNLFFNSDVGTVTATLVFKAHQPHPKNKETFLGYWKDDGFVKNRALGRCDYYNKWKTIKDKWLYEYENKKTTSYCFPKLLTHEDEWCAEAYMEVDYSNLQEEDFVKEMKNYLSSKITNSG